MSASANRGDFYTPVVNGLELKVRVSYYTRAGVFMEYRFGSWAAGDTFASALIKLGHTVTVSATYKGWPKTKTGAK